MEEKAKPGISNPIFRVELYDTQLSEAEIQSVAAAIRQATIQELAKIDFVIEDLMPLHVNSADARGCGGGCRSGSDLE